MTAATTPPQPRPEMRLKGGLTIAEVAAVLLVSVLTAIGGTTLVVKTFFGGAAAVVAHIQRITVQQGYTYGQYVDLVGGELAPPVSFLPIPDADTSGVLVTVRASVTGGNEPDAYSAQIQILSSPRLVALTLSAKAQPCTEVLAPEHGFVVDCWVGEPVASLWAVS